MEETLDIATYEQIATVLYHLMVNYNAIIDNYYNMFYNTEPVDITITLYGSDGTPRQYTIPNRAKDFNFIRNGEGSPEGVVSAPIGTVYQDTLNGVLYLKKIGTGNTGWDEVPSSSNIIEGSGSPEGAVSATKGTLYVDTASALLYIKGSNNSSLGWNKFSITGDALDKDLSNITSTGKTNITSYVMPDYSRITTPTGTYTATEDCFVIITGQSSAPSQVIVSGKSIQFYGSIQLLVGKGESVRNFSTGQLLVVPLKATS
jgi:hypothetical protein